MSLLIDPRICPDCRAPLDEASTCTGCGLRLTGPLAGELWRTMQTADSLVERLRVEVPESVTVASALPAAPASAPASAPPSAPAATPPPRRHGLAAGSVPT